MQPQKYILPNEVNQVSNNAGGIYFFTIRFPSDIELGLRKSTVDRDDIKKILVKKLDNYHRAYSIVNFSGEFNNYKADHLTDSYKLLAAFAPKKLPSDIIEELIKTETDFNKIRRLISILRLSLDFAFPLYIGITVKQSFYDRLIQHLNGDSNVLAALTECNLVWQDLYFCCFPFEKDEDLSIKDDLRNIEKLIQCIFKPRFSQK